MPLIFSMFMEMIRVNILADKSHQVYKLSKGTLERLLKLVLMLHLLHHVLLLARMDLLHLMVLLMTVYQAQVAPVMLQRRRASLISNHKVYLLASMWEGTTPRRFVPTSNMLMSSSSRSRQGKRSSWPNKTFYTTA